jgi:hypothetical protein
LKTVLNDVEFGEATESADSRRKLAYLVTTYTQNSEIMEVEKFSGKRGKAVLAKKDLQIWLYSRKHSFDDWRNARKCS